MCKSLFLLNFFFFNDTATTEIYTLSLHDALPISPQLPDKSLDLVTMNQLTFEVLSDVGGYVASDYGIVFALTPEDRTLMLEVGNDLVAYNGDDGLLLPAPSTFLIDPVGIVRFAHVGADFTGRLDASEVVAGLRRLARS